MTARRCSYQNFMGIVEISSSVTVSGREELCDERQATLKFVSCSRFGNPSASALLLMQKRSFVAGRQHAHCQVLSDSLCHLNSDCGRSQFQFATETRRILSFVPIILRQVLASLLMADRVAVPEGKSEKKVRIRREGKDFSSHVETIGNS